MEYTAWVASMVVAILAVPTAVHSAVAFMAAVSAAAGGADMKGFHLKLMR